MPTDKSSMQAKRLLHHYLQIGFQNSGYRWNSDNTAEVNEIVDSIIDACAQSTPAAPSTQSTQSTLSISSAQPDALTRIADALERIAAVHEYIAPF